MGTNIQYVITNSLNYILQFIVTEYVCGTLVFCGTQFDFHRSELYNISGRGVSKGTVKWKIVKIRRIQKWKNFPTERMMFRVLLEKKKSILCKKNILQRLQHKSMHSTVVFFVPVWLCFERGANADALCGLCLVAITLVLSQIPRPDLVISSSTLSINWDSHEPLAIYMQFVCTHVLPGFRRVDVLYDY